MVSYVKTTKHQATRVVCLQARELSISALRNRVDSLPIFTRYLLGGPRPVAALYATCLGRAPRSARACPGRKRDIDVEDDRLAHLSQTPFDGVVERVEESRIFADVPQLALLAALIRGG
jgi:hypothetical protein